MRWVFVFLDLRSLTLCPPNIGRTNSWIKHISGKVKHELQVQIHKLRVQIYVLQVQVHELRVQNIEFHELQKALFYCLASVELKSRTKVWKSFSAIRLWKMSMWILNYQHVLTSVIRYIRTKWVAPNKCRGAFFVHWFGQVH